MPQLEFAPLAQLAQALLDALSGPGRDGSFKRSPMPSRSVAICGCSATMRRILGSRPTPMRYSTSWGSVGAGTRAPSRPRRARTRPAHRPPVPCADAPARRAAIRGWSGAQAPPRRPVAAARQVPASRDSEEVDVLAHGGVGGVSGPGVALACAAIAAGGARVVSQRHRAREKAVERWRMGPPDVCSREARFAAKGKGRARSEAPPASMKAGHDRGQRRGNAAPVLAAGPHPPVHAAHQRQGRALHPNGAVRVGLCGGLRQLNERANELPRWLHKYNYHQNNSALQNKPPSAELDRWWTTSCNSTPSGRSARRSCRSGAGGADSRPGRAPARRRRSPARGCR